MRLASPSESGPMFSIDVAQLVGDFLGVVGPDADPLAAAA
jgi:hypothetical protein